jgi:diguanylate cyclase (GGDEF)-like protein
MIAMTGTAMSLLLALLAWSLANSRDRAVHMAKTMTRELRESEQRWAFALEGTGDGVWDWNLRTGLAVTSPRWHEIVACPQLLGNNTMAGWEARIHPDDLADFIDSRTAWLTAANNQSTWVIEHRICCPHVPDKWILLRGMVAERDDHGHPLRVIGTITDITERHAKETSMRHLAQHDALTDLPNRMLFNDRLAQALATVKRNHGRLALIFLDLDNFKPVNDIYGHVAGDKLLQVVAQRLRQSVRAVDTVARIGGDEFVLLLPEMNHPTSAHKLADKICQTMRMPIDLAGQAVEVSCSMGLAIYPEDGTDEETLIRNADLAMYRAKQGGRNQVQRTRKSADASSLPGQ